MNILLLGPPGAGKGTQGAILAQRLGVPKFATGDMIREAIAAGTPLGRQAKAVYDSGALVSDDLILGIVREAVTTPPAARGTVLDGVVRTIPQAEGMERMLAELGRKIDAVLFFDVSDDEILSRIEKRRTIEGRGPLYEPMVGRGDGEVRSRGHGGRPCAEAAPDHAREAGGGRICSSISRSYMVRC